MSRGIFICFVSFLIFISSGINTPISKANPSPQLNCSRESPLKYYCPTGFILLVLALHTAIVVLWILQKHGDNELVIFL